MTLLSFALLLMCTPTALIDFAIPKWKADKNVRIEDAYKWVHQATRGGEHAAPNRESAKKWLDREWLTLAEAKQNEPLWEPLCSGDGIGRLNLRPFKSKGGQPDDILDAFLTSSREYKATVAEFTAAWDALGKRLKKRSVGSLTHKAWLNLDAEMKAKNYPAVHHSKIYEAAEQPAYRILTSAEKTRLLSRLKLSGR